MLCISTAQYSIVLNGSAFGYFKGGRGIRQGDPISPYVFVICMEVLSRLLNQAKTVPEFRFHSGCKALQLNHLMFADNLILISAVDVFSPCWMKSKVDLFSSMSGLHVNHSKSQIFLSNASVNVQTELVQNLGFQLGKLPVKYLGVPLISSRLSIADCMPIIDKVKQRVSSWSTKFLSFAGRALLIKAILFHLQVYWSCIFVLPKGTIDAIDSVCLRFLWTGSYDKKGSVLVAWREVFVPRKEGGLGFKQLRAWNLAAMGKLLWRVHSNVNDIWVQWIRCKLKSKCIWQILIPQDCAWSWRKLLQLKCLF